MKYLFLIIAAMMLAGCEREIIYLDKDGRRVNPPSPPDYVKVLWEENHIKCCEIEGHRYFVGMSYGYSDGGRGIVHAESCPCKTNK